MNVRLLGLMAGGMALLSSSCLSFRTPSSTPVEPILENIEFCGSVTEGENVLKSAKVTDSFGQEDRQIYCVIRVRTFLRLITLRWKWYSPEKKLWKDTGEVKFDPKDGSIASVAAYDRVDQDRGGLAKGEWTVAVFLNGQLGGRGSFKIK